jgi:hypothetical protein
MKKSKRLKEIFKKNAEFEKESPYNFCDRWCERCLYEKQIRCMLYKDELERKLTCIAHGRDEDDPEITEAVLKEQYKDIDEKLSQCMDKFGIDLDNPGMDEDGEDEEHLVNFEDLPPDIQKHIRFVENNPLSVTAEQYRKKTYNFLKETFYKDEKKYATLNYDFQTVSWYHTLLSVKLQRALAGFHQPVSEDEFALYDAVAQFQICKKAIMQSVVALRKISTRYPVFAQQIQELIALLHNIHSRIVAMEECV